MKNWQKSCNFAYKDQNSIDTDTIFYNFAQHFSTFTFWYAALNEILKYNALRNHFELQFIFFVHVNFIDGVRFFSGRLLVTLSLWLVLMHFSWQLKKIVVIFFCVVIPLKQQQRKNCLFCIAYKMLEKSTWTWILYVVCVLFHLIFFSVCSFFSPIARLSWFVCSTISNWFFSCSMCMWVHSRLNICYGRDKYECRHCTWFLVFNTQIISTYRCWNGYRHYKTRHTRWRIKRKKNHNHRV